MSEKDALAKLKAADDLLLVAKTETNLPGAREFISSARGKIELAVRYLKGVVGEK